MAGKTLRVPMNASLMQVVREMALDGRPRTVTQQDEGKPVALFTVKDALKILAQILENEAALRLDVGDCLSAFAIQDYQREGQRIGPITWITKPGADNPSAKPSIKPKPLQTDEGLSDIRTTRQACRW